MTTREIILSELKKHGEARADDLAAPLGLTAMAVRQHLYQLQQDGAVDCISKVQGRGRPAKLWRLTAKADIYFPDAHRDLTLEFIAGIRSLLGEDALEKLLQHRAQTQHHHYEAVISTADSLHDKLNALAEARSREGYMAATARSEAGDLLFVENHCPICEAAKTCAGLCAKELSVFQDLFQGSATVERSEHILAGARRCAYKVTPK